MKESPLAAVKRQFEDKASLVKALRELSTDALWLDRVNELKGLERVSNAKLLKLHGILSEAKSRFGSRSGLIDALLEGAKRPKDASFRTRLERFPTPRLWDMLKTQDKHARQAAKAAKQAA